MRTLAEEIVETVQRIAEPVRLTSLAQTLGERAAETLNACEVADKEGRLLLFKRGRGGAWHVAAPDSGIRRCVICLWEFCPVAKGTRTCSHSCARHLAYQNEDMRKRHQASTKIAANRPGRIARMQEISRALVSDPAEIARRSECNRRSWANPEIRTKRVQSIIKAWQGPEGAKRRMEHRGVKLATWSDPEWRARTVAAMRTGSRGRFKRAVIELVNQTPHLSVYEIAAQIGLTDEQTKVLWRRCYRMGEVTRQPPDGRKLRPIRPKRSTARKQQQSDHSGAPA